MIHVRKSKRFGSGINERIEHSLEALLLKPLVGTIASLNAVHRGRTEDTQPDEAAAACPRSTSQLRDHVFSW